MVACAVIVPQEKNEAEQLFRKMEEKLLAAKTLRLKMTGELKEAGLALTGDCLFGEEGRLSIQLDGKQGEQAHFVKLVSDGKRIHVEESGRGQTEAFASASSVGKAARRSFAAAGFMGTLDALNRDEKVRNLETRVLVTSEFKLGAKEKVGDREAQIVEYSLAAKDSPEPGSTAVVWIDLATNLPLKRNFRNIKMSLTENYSDVKVDEKVEEAKFELPK